VQPPLTHGFSAGAGVGAFIRADKSVAVFANAPSKPVAIAGITLAYGMGERWVARAIWNRAGTRADSDSDIVLVGVGYRF
jgi:hypothetical protein